MPRQQRFARDRDGCGARAHGHWAGAVQAMLCILVAIVVLAGAPSGLNAAVQPQARHGTLDSAMPDPDGTVVRCDPPVVYAKTTEIATTCLYVQDVAGLNAADLWLTFNTGIGNVKDEDASTAGVQIQPISSFMSAHFVLFKSADNDLGEVHYAAAQMAKDPVDGSGPLAMVRFEALTTGTITLQFTKLHDLSEIDGRLIPNTA